MIEAFGDEQRFESGLIEVRMSAVERGDPLVQGREDGEAGFSEFDSDMMTDDILRVLEEGEEIGNELAFDGRELFYDGFGGVDSAPDPAVIVIPMGIAHGMLGMADDGAGEV